MHDLVIILAPPRSFTSVVCAMLGQHPQMYGLPEVNLFIAETMQERDVILAQRQFAQHGLLRVVAQLYANEQTVQTIELARRWLGVRANCTYEAVFYELAEKVSPRILIDKSHITILRSENLERIRRTFPNARFIHLLRHPKSQSESLWKLGGVVAGMYLEAFGDSTASPTLGLQKAWYNMHMNISTFLEGFSEQQKKRIRGEDVLADPDAYLRQITEWLGLSTDERAIESMKHPEQSPYACFGPVNAPFGNDPDFLRAPALRPVTRIKVQRPKSLNRRQNGRALLPEVKYLAREFGYLS